MKGMKELKAFMAANFIGSHDFFHSRWPEHVEIRAKAIRHLRAYGLTVCETANVMKCDHALISYWTNDEARRIKMARNLEFQRNRRKYRQLGAALEVLHA